MNERIRELEVQAGMQYRLGQIVNIDKNGTHTFEEEKVYDTFDTEKFAELIVRECMSFQDEAGVYSKFDMANAIARCFGVEE
jgi:hypothetical protein